MLRYVVVLNIYLSLSIYIYVYTAYKYREREIKKKRQRAREREIYYHFVSAGCITMIKETLIHSSDCRTHRDFWEISFFFSREKIPTRRTISFSSVFGCCCRPSLVFLLSLPLYFDSSSSIDPLYLGKFSFLARSGTSFSSSREIDDIFFVDAFSF